MVLPHSDGWGLSSPDEIFFVHHGGTAKLISRSYFKSSCHFPEYQNKNSSERLASFHRNTWDRNDHLEQAQTIFLSCLLVILLWLHFKVSFCIRRHCRKSSSKRCHFTPNIFASWRETEGMPNCIFPLLAISVPVDAAITTTSDSFCSNSTIILGGLSYFFSPQKELIGRLIITSPLFFHSENKRKWTT